MSPQSLMDNKISERAVVNCHQPGTLSSVVLSLVPSPVTVAVDIFLALH